MPHLVHPEFESACAKWTSSLSNPSHSYRLDRVSLTVKYRIDTQFTTNRWVVMNEHIRLPIYCMNRKYTQNEAKGDGMKRIRICVCEVDIVSCQSITFMPLCSLSLFEDAHHRSVLRGPDALAMRCTSSSITFIPFHHLHEGG